MTHGTGGQATEDLFRALSPRPNNRNPLYLQLQEGLRELIGSGRLRRGDAIPAERDLAILAGVSRVTVRKAVNALVDAGMLTRKVGAGTFVSGRIEQPLSHLLGFSEDMRARGYEPGSIWLNKSIARASPDEAMALGIAPSAPVVRLRRIRTANGEPIALETAVASVRDLPSPDLVTDSFYEALRARHLVPTRALQRIRAGLASEEEARLLGLTHPAAVLQIERRTLLEDGRTVEVTFSSWRDLYDFVAELRAHQDDG